MRAVRRFLVAGFLLAASCSDSLSPRDFDGTWGTEGARLTLSLTAALFETSCWMGELTMPLIVDGEEFTALSTLNWRGGAGQQESRAVTFTGRRSGNVLHLSVTPASLGLGPYTMVEGQPVSLPGCP